MTVNISNRLRIIKELVNNSLIGEIKRFGKFSQDEAQELMDDLYSESYGVRVFCLDNGEKPYSLEVDRGIKNA